MRAHALSYTDASYEHETGLGGIAAFIPDLGNRENGFGGSFDRAMELGITDDIIKYFHGTSIIYALELLALVLTLFELAATLKNRTLVAFIDNNAALFALIRGASKIPLVDRLIAIFWKTSDEYNISIWMERVPSASNISDLPTRDTPLWAPTIDHSIFWPWN